MASGGRSRSPRLRSDGGRAGRCWARELVRRASGARGAVTPAGRLGSRCGWAVGRGAARRAGRARSGGVLSSCPRGDGVGAGRFGADERCSARSRHAGCPTFAARGHVGLDARRTAGGPVVPAGVHRHRRTRDSGRCCWTGEAWSFARRSHWACAAACGGARAGDAGVRGGLSGSAARACTTLAEWAGPPRSGCARSVEQPAPPAASSVERDGRRRRGGGGCACGGAQLSRCAQCARRVPWRSWPARR